MKSPLQIQSAKTIFSVLLLPALLTACTKPTGPQAVSHLGSNITRISAISEQAASCLNDIRQRMVAKSIPLMTNERLGQNYVLSANGLLAKTTEHRFGLSQFKDLNHKLAVEHFTQDQNLHEGVSYELSLSDGETLGPLALEIEYSRNQETKSEKLKEKFQLSASCEMTLTEADLEVYKKNGSNYEYARSSDFVDGTSENVTKQFTLPASSSLANLIIDQDDTSLLDSNMSLYEEEIGLARIQKNQTSLKTFRASEQDIPMQITDVEIKSGEKSLLVLSVGSNADKSVTVTISGMGKSWLLPKAMWDVQSLSGDFTAFSPVTSELPQDYFQSHNSMRLQASQIPNYDHFSAYWAITDPEPIGKNETLMMELLENPNANIEGAVLPSDLVSNETIQADLPAIIRIRDSILSESASDRRIQVELILKYLHEHYTFDKEMMKNNIVRSLSTEEALNRGMGVCQHYAVIFTAIARSLKIPSRIVMGYLLYGNPGAHAWVEAEVERGKWQVIEPQLPNAPTETHTRFYLPLMRADFLEDKNADQSAMFRIYQSLNDTLLPDLTSH